MVSPSAAVHSKSSPGVRPSSSNRDVSLSAATTALFGEITADVSGGFGIGFTEPMSFTHALIVVLLWAFAATIAAYAGLVARDA